MNEPIHRLTGLSLSDFDASHWGTAPLVTKAAHSSSDVASDLFSLDAVDELLSRRGLRTPFLRMTRNGEVVPPARYTRSGGAGAEIADQVADDKVLMEFSAGATLVLQGLHRMWPPIQSFASALSSQLGHPVQVNAYVTPPMSAALAPHYDVHDVFIVQVAGRKHWRVHEPVLKAPQRNEPWSDRKAEVTARSSESPLVDTMLESGDTMYLPRGFIHAAESRSDISCHLTFGVHPHTRQTIADQVFAILAGDIELRRSLRAGIDLSNGGTLESELDTTIEALRSAIDRIDRSAVTRRISRHAVAGTRPAPLRPLEQFAMAAALTPETRVHLRPGLTYTERTDAVELIIELLDRNIRFPMTHSQAVRTATSGATVAAATLPGVSIADGVELIAKLLRNGLVIPA